eukprot:CAMPEP_0170185182 /NCGR_PEP_ID=MMETSP0040_2-20121228/35851_1 /TAXON_ID=641309 /ORGANISM="Lotharella oceanica, Strain CCMP622" /LENGTH=253 /DNA_ID=CAMNT_0010431503 /DNA_START=18 /DNA_END=779 /DNA_ORIENTATION=+
MSCCPPSRCGLAPPSDYKAKGKEIKLGDLSCYEIGEAKKGAVVVIADIFGLASGRHKGICDELAEKGYYVIMPDLYHGDKCEFADLGTEKLPAFLKKWKPEAWRPDMDAVYKHLEEKKLPPKSIGLMGFCWGCWAIWHESARVGEKFAAGVNFHPSIAIEKVFGRTIDDLAKKLKNPMLMCPCKGEPEEVLENGSGHKIMLKKDFGKACEFISFLDMQHGFVSQGDVSKKEIKDNVTKALDGALTFLGKVVSA